MDGPLTKGKSQDVLGNGELVYRLREKVSYVPENGRPLFILAYPLKALRLHPAWVPLVERLSRREFVPLSDLEKLIEKIPGDRLRFFLDEMVRKGFLETQGVPPLSEPPAVSVIIPVRNRPVEIRSCLESLLRVEYPPGKLEILVVDDASTDNTPEVISRFPVSLIRLTENRQAPFCRNLGARRARGELLAFIDSDCQAGPSWLKELVPMFQDPSVAVTGGKVDSGSSRKGLDRYEQVMSSLNGGDWPRRSTGKDPFFYVPSCNLLVRREVFISVGGFQEELVVGEDVDLCWRLQDRGHSIEYRPGGTVFHHHRNRLKSFCSRRFDYGTSEPLLQKRHPRRVKTFGFPPAGTIFWIVLLMSLWRWSWSLTILATGIPFADAAVRTGRLQRGNIPLAFRFVLASVLRDYLGLVYHGFAFLSRYYLGIGLLLTFFLPGMAIFMVGVQMLIGSVVYASRRPRLNFLSFQLFFLLEQLSYQAGVWWGCLKHLRFNAIAPKPVAHWNSPGLS